MSFDPTRIISREELNELPIRRYEGPVHLVSTAHELAPALDDLLQEKVVGFDTETRPAFRPGESYPPSLAQFASARAVYLFQVRHADIAEGAARLLSSDQVIKAGVGLKDDLNAMRKLIQFTEKNTVDLGTLAVKSGLKQTGVRNLAGIFLGFRIPKGAKTTNWARANLTPQQITYAATDAWACRELYMEFRKLGLA